MQGNARSRCAGVTSSSLRRKPIRALFRYGEQPNFPPRYNVAPTQPISVVRLVDGKRSFALIRWGLLPSWVKEPKTFPLLINARDESVLDKPAFRNAIRRRRCLIPTDGFYEWPAGPAAAGPKRPYFVRAKRGEDGTAPPLAFAGLWETWTGPNGEEFDTAAIGLARGQSRGQRFRGADRGHFGKCAGGAGAGHLPQSRRRSSRPTSRHCFELVG
jgi:putative SOS response-associated peptidase YedK